MITFINKALKYIRDVVFTVRCPYCGRVTDINNYACEDCKKKFPKNSVSTYAVGGYKCCAPFLYDGIFAQAVWRFKFKNGGAFAKQLAAVVAMAVLEMYDIRKFDIITCVPMHKKSEKKRGYNQAKLLARECAAILNIPYEDTLIKHKENFPQHETNAIGRAKNVKGVYILSDKADIKGKNILLIDDIITTGNTLGECARILTTKGKCAGVSCATICMSAKR